MCLHIATFLTGCCGPWAGNTLKLQLAVDTFLRKSQMGTRKIMEMELSRGLTKWAMNALGTLMIATIILSMFLTIVTGILLMGSSIFGIYEETKIFEIPIFDALTIAIGLIVATGLAAALNLCFLIIVTTSVRLPWRKVSCRNKNFML